MSATTWILIVVVVVALLLYGLSQIGRPREISDEEFEREAKRRGSLIGTGLQEFQAFLDPGKKAALEAIQEEKRKTTQEVSGDLPEAGKSGRPE